MYYVLKIEDEFYEVKVVGIKFFEICFNDRGF